MDSGRLLPGLPKGCAPLFREVMALPPFSHSTQRGTGFMSDLLVNIQGLAQDQPPGHSPPAACPTEGLGGGLWEGLGSPLPHPTGL